LTPHHPPQNAVGPPPPSIACQPEMMSTRGVMVMTKHGEINVPIPGMTFDDGGAATIYIGNVHYSITIEQIVQFFTAVCGEVLIRNHLLL